MSAILSVFTDEDTDKIANYPRHTVSRWVRVQTQIVQPWREPPPDAPKLHLISIQSCVLSWLGIHSLLFLFLCLGLNSVLILNLNWLHRPYCHMCPSSADSLICPTCSKYRGRFGQEKNNGQWSKADLGLNTGSAILPDDLKSHSFLIHRTET